MLQKIVLVLFVLFPTFALAVPPDAGLVNLALRDTETVCKQINSSQSTTDDQGQVIWAGDRKIVAVACQDLTNLTAALVTPFTVQYKRGDTGNLIGGEATCGSKDGKSVWTIVDGDPDGSLPSGAPVWSSVTNSPNPASGSVIYCFATKPR